MGPKLDVKVGDDVAVVNWRGECVILKVESIVRGTITTANGSRWCADGTPHSKSLFARHLEIVTEHHRTLVAEEAIYARVRACIDRFPELRNHLPVGRAELLREVAEHLEAALALLDGAK
jgi:hypothetical protein